MVETRNSGNESGNSEKPEKSLTIVDKSSCDGLTEEAKSPTSGILAAFAEISDTKWDDIESFYDGDDDEDFEDNEDENESIEIIYEIDFTKKPGNLAREVEKSLSDWIKNEMQLSTITKINAATATMNLVFFNDEQFQKYRKMIRAVQEALDQFSSGIQSKIDNHVCFYGDHHKNLLQAHLRTESRNAIDDLDNFFGAAKDQDETTETGRLLAQQGFARVIKLYSQENDDIIQYETELMQDSISKMEDCFSQKLKSTLTDSNSKENEVLNIDKIQKRLKKYCLKSFNSVFDFEEKVNEITASAGKQLYADIEKEVRQIMQQIIQKHDSESGSSAGAQSQGAEVEAPIEDSKTDQQTIYSNPSSSENSQRNVQNHSSAAAAVPVINTGPTSGHAKTTSFKNSVSDNNQKAAKLTKPKEEVPKSQNLAPASNATGNETCNVEDKAAQQPIHSSSSKPQNTDKKEKPARNSKGENYDQIKDNSIPFYKETKRDAVQTPPGANPVDQNTKVDLEHLQTGNSDLNVAFRFYETAMKQYIYGSVDSKTIQDSYQKAVKFTQSHASFRKLRNSEKQLLERYQIQHLQNTMENAEKGVGLEVPEPVTKSGHHTSANQEQPSPASNADAKEPLKQMSTGTSGVTSDASKPKGRYKQANPNKGGPPAVSSEANKTTNARPPPNTFTLNTESIRELRIQLKMRCTEVKSMIQNGKFKAASENLIVSAKRLIERARHAGDIQFDKDIILEHIKVVEKLREQLFEARL